MILAGLCAVVDWWFGKSWAIFVLINEIWRSCFITNNLGVNWSSGQELHTEIKLWLPQKYNDSQRHLFENSWAIFQWNCITNPWLFWCCSWCIVQGIIYRNIGDNQEKHGLFFNNYPVWLGLEWEEEIKFKLHLILPVGLFHISFSRLHLSNS